MGKKMKRTLAFAMCMIMMLQLCGCVSIKERITVKNLNETIKQSIEDKDFSDATASEIKGVYVELSDEAKEMVNDYEFYMAEYQVYVVVREINKGDFARAALDIAKVIDYVKDDEHKEEIMAALTDAVLIYGPKILGDDTETIDNVILILKAVGLEESEEGKTMISLLEAYKLKNQVKEDFSAVGDVFDTVTDFIKDIGNEISNYTNALNDE